MSYHNRFYYCFRLCMFKPHTKKLQDIFKVYLLFGGDGTPLINRLPDDIHNPAQGLGTHWNSDGGTSVQNLLSTDQTLSTIHSNGTHCVLP